MRRWGPSVTVPLLLAILAGLPGCVDPYINAAAPLDASRWQGTSTQGRAALLECGAFQFDIDGFPDPSGGPQLVTGQATRQLTADAGPLDGVLGPMRNWWVEGWVWPDRHVQIETRLQPVTEGQRPYSVWYGHVEDGRVLLIESPAGSPCGREAQLTRR